MTKRTVTHAQIRQLLRAVRGPKVNTEVMGYKTIKDVKAAYKRTK